MGKKIVPPNHQLAGFHRTTSSKQMAIKDGRKTGRGKGKITEGIWPHLRLERRGLVLRVIMALGAPRRRVLGLELWEVLVLALPGLLAGLAAAMAGARLVSSKLNLPLGLAEPSVFAWTALVLIVVTLLASYVPAHRATMVDPMTALRAE